MDDNVVEGQIEEAPVVKEGNSSDIMLNMEGMIKNIIAQNDKLGEEAKKLKEMLDDIFGNDPTYQQHSEAAKEATKIKSNTKKQILKRPEAADLDLKVKSLKSQIKENQASLSDYLQEYARMSGQSEIEGDDGEVREIVYTAKLIKKSWR